MSKCSAIHGVWVEDGQPGYHKCKQCKHGIPMFSLRGRSYFPTKVIYAPVLNLKVYQAAIREPLHKNKEILLFRVFSWIPELE